MGTNAANATTRVLNNTDRVMAIQALAVAQAVDISGEMKKLSGPSVDFYNKVRKASDAITSKSAPSMCIEAVERAIFRPIPAWQK